MKRCGSVVAIALCSVALTACGGGGSSSVPRPPNPTPTPTGQPGLSCSGALTIDAAQRKTSSSIRRSKSVSNSQYTFASNPSGLNVTVNNASIGKTQVNTTPGFVSTPYVGSIVGPNSTYTVCYSQLFDGNHTVFYNSASDTNGRIGSIATSASSQSSGAISVSGLMHRGVVVHPPGGFDQSRIQVHFVTAAIHGDPKVAAAIEHSVGATRAYTLGPVGDTLNRIVFIPAGQTPDSLAAKFRQHSEVADARTLPLRYTQSVSPYYPNDTFFDDINQWDFFQIDAPQAWGITMGKAPIAIIDTGADLTAFDLKVQYEVRWVANEPPYPDVAPGAAQDYDGHGTNVSGIADAVTNNSYGFAGVGFNAPYMILRIFPTPKAPKYTSDPSYGASTADEAEAIDDAVLHGAKVINLSLGSCPSQDAGPDPTEYAAVEGAIAKGVVVVAAAGNERSGGSSCGVSNTIDFPAAYPGVIAVGATSLHGTSPSNATEYVASYSNSGPGLAVVAPGGDPTSNTDNNSLHWITNLYSSTVADPSQACVPVKNTHPPLCAALFAGTSQATPHVTGTVALMRSRNLALQPAQIKRIVENTADNINDPNQGYGRLNAYRAVAAAAGMTTGAPPPNPLNFRAIAYTVSPGSNRPTILDVTFPAGVPVQSTGTFRVADVPQGSPSFEIGLWYDANGDGIVDAGDYFGSAGPCNATSACAAAATINVSLVPSGFHLK